MLLEKHNLLNCRHQTFIDFHKHSASRKKITRESGRTLAEKWHFIFIFKLLWRWWNCCFIMLSHKSQLLRVSPSIVNYFERILAIRPTAALRVEVINRLNKGRIRNTMLYFRRPSKSLVLNLLSNSRTYSIRYLSTKSSHGAKILNTKYHTQKHWYRKKNTRYNKVSKLFLCP